MVDGLDVSQGDGTTQLGTAEATDGWAGAVDGGKLWIGQHSADLDILVLDPVECDPNGAVLTLYSLTQHRMRTFPRTVVNQKILPLDDEIAEARARKDYARRSALREEHESTMVEERTKRKEVVRGAILEAHRRYVEGLGLPYQGAVDDAPDRKPGRAVRCHSCGIWLDDFVGASCATCSAGLCSCGACSCGRETRSRAGSKKRV
jgi:hypothetical protein